PIVRLFWTDAVPNDQTFSALETLAADTAYVGHSSSITRCQFLRADNMSLMRRTQIPQRSVYAGRFGELQNSYGVFVQSAGKKGRPLPGLNLQPERQTVEKLPHAFERQWLLLEHE